MNPIVSPSAPAGAVHVATNAVSSPATPTSTSQPRFRRMLVSVSTARNSSHATSGLCPMKSLRSCISSCQSSVVLLTMASRSVSVRSASLFAIPAGSSRSCKSLISARMPRAAARSVSVVCPLASVVPIAERMNRLSRAVASRLVRIRVHSCYRTGRRSY